MDVGPNILTKNQNFKKLRHSFVDKRVPITTTLIPSCHWKTLVAFCLQKKRLANAFLTLILNYHKIVRKNKYAIQNNNNMAIQWYMMLLIHCLF